MQTRSGTEKVAEARITRGEAEELIRAQFKHSVAEPEKAAYHYGRCELTALLDAIYGEGSEVWERRKRLKASFLKLNVSG